MIAAIEAMRVFVSDEAEAARLRLVESVETPVETTVALAAFESPKDSRKEP